MFRRPGKNPLEESVLYKEDPQFASHYKYGVKKNEPHHPSSHSNEAPPRIFESQHGSPLVAGFETPHKPHATPMNKEEHDENWRIEKTTPLTHHFPAMLKEEEPETTLGEGVSFRGELTFERLLRIDGNFEGELLSQGKVIVGPKGIVKANLNLREAVIEGKVIGNVFVQEKLELRGQADVRGDIQAKTLCVDEGVKIVGHVTIISESEQDESF